MTSRPRHLPVAALLFCSGFCALIYQTVWLREFRLIFGSSTPATAAVLGIFMGGLGLGSALLGRRVEQARRPLLYYGNLELLIALAAALTPALVWLVRQLYAATGGSVVLGHTAGTLVRLVLAAIVLVVPTFLMGGTLPAAARAASSEDDAGRRSLALLYGCNTLGAVLGAALSTFWLVELFGNRLTLWLACGLNLVVAIVARGVGRAWAEVPDSAPPEDDERTAGAGWRFVVVAAALVGFAFMLMELVWYRMLGPILGGSTFTFGLILVVALLGIGLGGAAYAQRGMNRPALLGGFALTCALEAACIALPYALGDRLALLALMLRPLGALGFAGHVFGWSIVTALVVLPAALVAGYQFPMLIGLLGRGRSGVARHTGLAYAANTVGAIVGSLAGGFGLLPLLGAPGAWQAVAALLAVLAVVAAGLGLRRDASSAAGSLAFSAAAVALLFATGPTHAWRHSGIGAGRADLPSATTNLLRELRESIARAIVWEADGIESSVAISAKDGFAFVVNGKIDGHARGDAGTQVMGGLVGALARANPRRSLVIGLGTGSTAGWLGQVPSMERVDVVELEPAIVEMARRCAPVNADVLHNPKVKIHIGDAREVLLATPERYDVIFSEPSNPYRAGIASLFTQDFYRAIVRRLNPGGVFVQWVQAYDVDGEAVRTAFATLGSVFPHVQTWRSQPTDLLLVATLDPLSFEADTLRARIATEPFRTVLPAVWRVDSIEGVLGHFLANEEFARRVCATHPPLATDDRNALEFGFARGVGRSKNLNLPQEMLGLARAAGLDRPTRLTGTIDWEKVAAEETSFAAMSNAESTRSPNEPPVEELWRQFFARYQAEDHIAAAAWAGKHRLQPRTLFETETLAEVLAAAGNEHAVVLIDRVATWRPNDAEALRGIHFLSQHKPAEAIVHLEKAFTAWRTDPWMRHAQGRLALAVAQSLAATSADPAVAPRLFAALGKPFAVENLRNARELALVEIALHTGRGADNPSLRAALAPFAKHPVWTKEFLKKRATAYRDLKDPQLESAARDLGEFIEHEPALFSTGVSASPAASAPAAAK